MAVQVIKASKTTDRAAAQDSEKKLRVAAYCRVSTDSDEQETSYEAQCRHYTDYIGKNPAWELAGIYADEGISGTQAKKRPEFLKMIAACEAGEIDYIITKSISRWARNTLDSLNYIRRLKTLGIAGYFEKENMNTMDAKGEVQITIMSSIAQQESQSISQNVRMGIQYQMQQGKMRINTTTFMGYGRGETPDALVIIPEEAEIVRRIFREFLEGFSPALIAKHLEQDSVRTKSGCTRWYPSTIAHMLRNEKYAGDMLLQKYYTEDFLTHRVVKNRGQLPQYYVKDHHEPIIPREVYRQVQDELMRRASLKEEPSKLRFGRENALTGRLICGRCGNVLKEYRRTDNSAADWRCRNRSYIKKTGGRDIPSPCGCRFVPEKEAKWALLTAFGKLPEYRDELLRRQGQMTKGEIRRVDALLDRSREIEKCMEERRTFLEMHEAKTGSSEIAFLDRQIRLEQQGRRPLVLERAECANRGMQIRMLLEWIDGIQESEDRLQEAACSDYEDFFRRTRHIIQEGLLDRNGRMLRFDDALIIRYLDRVTVLDDGFEVFFKAGIHIKAR